MFNLTHSRDRTPLKKHGFISQDHIGEFSTKREYTNTTHKTYKTIDMKFK
jgi:hypothetical protein